MSVILPANPGGHYRSSRSCARADCRVVAALLVALSLAIVAPVRADIFNGEEIYRQHCELCHGAGGNPVLPEAPNFARGDGLMQPDRLLAQAIRNGKGAMPGFYGVLTDQEVIDVVAYLRTLF